MLALPCAPALTLPPPHVQIGYAATYGQPGDDNGRFACRAVLVKRLGRRGWERALAHGVAHRSLPCGTRLHVYDLATGRQTRAVVTDRGPYGALDRGRWVLKRKAEDPGRWRGVLDVLPSTGARLGLRDGLHPVVLRVLP